MGDMETIYKEAVLLSDMAEVLKESIHQHNPGIDSKNKISLATLAADAETLVVRFGNLRVDILEIHEERQRNEHNPNS
jgi:hypothetical protein